MQSYVGEWQWQDHLTRIQKRSVRSVPLCAQAPLCKADQLPKPCKNFMHGAGASVPPLAVLLWDTAFNAGRMCHGAADILTI